MADAKESAGGVLASAHAAADGLFDEPESRAAIMDYCLSVHDIADAFRNRLRQRVQHERAIRMAQSAPPCVECGRLVTHPVHARGVPAGLEMRDSPGDPGGPAHPYRSES